jgi:hypothetical protein
MQYIIDAEEVLRAKKAGIRFMRVNGMRLEELTAWGRWMPHSRYADKNLVEEGIKYTLRSDPGMVVIRGNNGKNTP